MPQRCPWVFGTKGPCGALLGGCLTVSCSPSAGVMSLLCCADLKLFAGGLDALSVFLSLSHVISAANQAQDKECLGCRSRGSAESSLSTCGTPCHPAELFPCLFLVFLFSSGLCWAAESGGSVEHLDVAGSFWETAHRVWPGGLSWVLCSC